jgi:hypothetical protein
MPPLFFYNFANIVFAPRGVLATVILSSINGRRVNENTFLPTMLNQ